MALRCVATTSIEAASSLPLTSCAEEGDVGVVTPASVDRPALNCRDDLFGIHHGKRVPTHGHCSPEKARHLDLFWRGHDGVANAESVDEMRARDRWPISRTRTPEYSSSSRMTSTVALPAS